MKIGFIGPGQMGAAIAANLLKAGHDVTVWNRSAEKAQPLLEAGFTSVKQLVGKIDHFVNQYNADCSPFVWTATADSILAKIERLTSHISGTEHWVC
jgi:6-phosphogluconate dehydrogenase (decarboxylating)